MLSGRQSHVNLKSKEAWFYEHLPVLIFAINYFDEKLATEHEFCFCIIIAHVSVLALSLNCICLEYIDWLFVFQYVLTDIPACIFGQVNICFLAVTFRNSKKRSYTL